MAIKACLGCFWESIFLPILLLKRLHGWVVHDTFSLIQQNYILIKHQISFHCLDISYVNHSWNPLSPYETKGVGPSKNWVTWGVPNFLLEKRDNPEKEGGGVLLMLKWGVATFFITLQFTHIYCVCGKSKVSFITFRFFSLKKFIICKFLIHCGSPQKNVDCFIDISLDYTENYMDKLSEHQGKMFLYIEKVLVKISQEQP